MTRDLPPYVLRSSELVYAPPYDAAGTTILAFALPAEQRRIGELLARYFNQPSGGAVDFRAALPVVILTVADIAALRPADPPGNALGTVGEREVAVWVPVIDATRDQLVWFHPYLFVDVGIAMAAGREVHGFHKQIGDVTLGDRSRPGTLVSLDVTGVTRFAPTARFERLRLLDIAQKGAPSGGVFADLAGIATGIDAAGGGARAMLHALGGGLAGLVEEARVMAHLGRELAARTCTMVFLKQFRDAVEPERACHQSIVMARSRVTSFRGGGLLGACVVTVNDLDTQPLRADLGLPAGVITPLASWWLTYDFVMEKGTELWNAKSS